MYLRVGMPYQEAVKLIGPPENFANLGHHEIGYEIEVDYGWNIDPVVGTVMVLKFTRDSTLIDYQLDAWK